MFESQSLDLGVGEPSDMRLRSSKYLGSCPIFGIIHFKLKAAVLTSRAQKHRSTGQVMAKDKVGCPKLWLLPQQTTKAADKKRVSVKSWEKAFSVISAES